MRDLLERERLLLSRVHKLLERAGRGEDARRMQEAAAALSDAFLVVVVGEFNSGKSSVVNALFGEKIMEEGPVPTTPKITLIRYGQERMERVLSHSLLERRVPSKFLEDVTLVDTPGTNSIIAEHQQLTEDFIPRADLIVFVTSYDRPLTQSEADFLSFIRGDWGKQFVCVVNKSDLARSAEDLAKVLAHVSTGIEDRFGLRPELFALSAALAYEAKLSTSDIARAALDEKSRFSPFEAFVKERLAGPERLKIKLGGPLSSARAQLGSLDQELTARKALLDEATVRIERLRQHGSATESALNDTYQRPLAEIDALVDDTRGRGVRFFEDAFRITNIGLLRDKDRFKDEFQRQVVRSLDREIEERVTRAVDAMQKRALELWQQALTALRDAISSSETSETGFDRARAFVELEREAERQLRLHDVREEARVVLEQAQQSANITQAMGIGAAGIGVLGGVLIATTTADAFGGLGLVTAAVLAAGSLTFLPMQKRRAIAQLEERVGLLKRDLRAALEEQLRAQVKEVARRIEKILAPLEAQATRDQESLTAMIDERAALLTEIEAVRAEIDR